MKTTQRAIRKSTLADLTTIPTLRLTLKGTYLPFAIYHEGDLGATPSAVERDSAMQKQNHHFDSKTQLQQPHQAAERRFGDTGRRVKDMKKEKLKN
jgi:hypothetical protein